jgi:UDP-N-acetylglucosamine 4,6-dehydratase
MRSVLISGGTGSFGQAFTRRLLQDSRSLHGGADRNQGGTIERIAILSRGEHAQAEMAERFNDPRLRFFIGDVRDRDRLRRAFAGVDVVIHAAALKRIEVGAYNPEEMVKTNIVGAMNVVEAAMDANVRRIVALSTDKAYQPISPYGQSKAIAETIFRNAYRSDGGPIFAITRYGNVWNSKGSVVPKWREILKTSDTVPVSDPDCTRFFMRMSEAVDLVMNTIETMQGGELNIPTLPAYRLADLAAAMGATMKITGLPEWEKKHEGMCDGNTSDVARRMTVTELREELYADGLHSPGPDGFYSPSWQGPSPLKWSHCHWRGVDTLQANTGC